jgi:hypothetical protein
MSNPSKVYIIKAAWRATSKLLRIEAKDADEALKKAKKAKENRGCLVISLISERP